MGDQDVADDANGSHGPSRGSTSAPDGAQSDTNGPVPTQTTTPTNTPPTTDSKVTAPPDSSAQTMAVEVPELDDFGLPVRKYVAPSTPVTTPGTPTPAQSRRASGTPGTIKSAATSRKASTSKAHNTNGVDPEENKTQAAALKSADSKNATDSKSGEDCKDAVSRPEFANGISADAAGDEEEPKTPMPPRVQDEEIKDSGNSGKDLQPASEGLRPQVKHGTADEVQTQPDEKADKSPEPDKLQDKAISEAKKDIPVGSHSRNTSTTSTANGLGIVGVSEFSHQQLTTHDPDKKEDSDEDEWQTMPAYAPYDLYDDDNRLIAREQKPEDLGDTYGYAGLGGAGKGYTRVIMDDDVESVNSIDENTQYLFKEAGANTSIAQDEETQRDAVSQLQATKDLLTEGQRIAYVGLTRLEMSVMVKEAEELPLKANSKRTKKEVQIAAESIKMWSQKMMIRLYTHMDISPAEQIMIEQLSDHGVMPQDLTPVLMANARVKNPMAEEEKTPSRPGSGMASPRPSSARSPVPEEEEAASPPPPYSANDDHELSEPVRTPSQMPTTAKIDIDIRWTVLCDLFLVLIADSVYDSRSRTLLEKVGKDLEIPWVDICRFEKKVTDALEMQQQAEKENWNEDQHMEARRKMALKKRYVLMGLATVGGGLVIGLSAGLMAPLIGAGLAAGFTTIGVTGTGGFLAGVGGAALITSSAAASGGVIGVRSMDRRTGAVKTFEYRPLHNNKRVNLIITVSGWMTGKVDDVRLPYSTVDPAMGDIYSVLWEPEMLTTMGDTINILATEALTQGLQQLLGSTILVSLMAALQLPVVLTKLSYLIDNPWAVSLDRATMAGLILADSLIDRNLGTRPVTLVGYSLGSRVIFSCLQELARKGAFGLVQNVYLFGSPMVVKQDEYTRARAVVSGRFVNGYNRNDWILGYLFRLTNGGIRRIAGLGAIAGVPGIENMDLTEHVVGHMDYRTAMPRLLRECGWLVDSDEFTEIEDPDPDNHQERQRELINEIEEARKELAKQEQEEKEGGGGAPGKSGKAAGGFGFFSRKKRAQKQEWEVYEDALRSAGGRRRSATTTTAEGGGSSSSAAVAARTEDAAGNNHGVLFDVDAIRAELAREHHQQRGGAGIDPADAALFQVKEIKSTLPPMKLELGAGGGLAPPTPAVARPPPRDALRETRSADAVPYRRHPAQHEHRSAHDLRLPPSEPAPPPEWASSARSSHERVASSSPARGWTTPTPSPAPGYFGRGEDGDEEVQMTFDTSFEESMRDDAHGSPPPPPPPPKDGGFDDGGGPLTRPALPSARTVPNITLSDPWADDDDEFGREKEISMTFA